MVAHVQILAKAGLEFSSQEQRRILQRFDVDNDGYVSIKEFTDFFKALMAEPEQVAKIGHRGATQLAELPGHRNLATSRSSGSGRSGSRHSHRAKSSHRSSRHRHRRTHSSSTTALSSPIKLDRGSRSRGGEAASSRSTARARVRQLDLTKV